jgi:hypothetical protein
LERIIDVRTVGEAISSPLAAGARAPDTALVNLRTNGTIRAVGSLMLLGFGATLRAQSTPESSKRAFVEMTVDRASYFVGESIRVRIRFGIERAFLEKNVLQAFQGSLAVPAHLLVPWWGNLPGASALPAARRKTEDRVTFVRNGQVALGHRSEIERPRGVEVTVVEIERGFRAERVGVLSLAGPKLRFRYATKFREDFINGRIAEDSIDAIARADSVDVVVRPVPEAGRPAAFTGGVGDFEVRAEVTPTEVSVGASLELVLRIRGDGNLSSLGAPSLAGLSAFHVRGRVDDRGSSERTITYDLMVVRVVSKMPKIEFAFFEPGDSPRFRRVYTDAIPLVVKPLPPGETLDLPGAGTEPVVAGRNDIFDLKLGATRSRAESVGSSSAYVLLALLVIPWLAAAGLRSWLRMRRTHQEPDRVRARGAAAVHRSKVFASGEDAAEALAEYIAARLHVPPSAVIRDDLPAQLEAVGVSPDLAARTARVLHDLVAVRYGGGSAARSEKAAAALVDALEREIRPPRR